MKFPRGSYQAIVRRQKHCVNLWANNQKKANYKGVIECEQPVFGAKLKAWGQKMFHIFTSYNLIWFSEVNAISYL